MAAILKLRRGTSIPSLQQSELFYHSSLNTLVVGDGSNSHILLKSGSNTVDTVNISGTAELRVNSATANSFVYYDANKSLESVQPSTAGDVIQWNGSSFVASNEIDGGTF